MSEEALTSTHPEGPSSPEDPSHRTRKTRLPRACTSRPPSHRYLIPTIHRRPNPRSNRRPSTTASEDDQQPQCSSVITPLVHSPPPLQLPRWGLRSMWELASLLNFLHVFRPLLNIGVEFSAEELETALITPNDTLGNIHIPLLKAIPPIARMALGHTTWVTVLCRKLKVWWHWVADGEIPIVASHGAEVEAYKTLEPGTRLIILKALCDIRVEQEDIRSYIDESVKHGIQLSAFRKERIGGDSHGTSYWYEDDPIIGHRLYREIRKVEVKKMKIKSMLCLPLVSCQWETVATNLDEFQEVSEKLLLSKNRTEVAVGKRLKFDILSEIEKIHKRKERLLKKQQREALLLDSFFTADGVVSGRSLRDRKPVTYTFDDYDRSINEAIKETKKRQASPEPFGRREVAKHEVYTNGGRNGLSQERQQVSNDTPSPRSTDYNETDGEHKYEFLDRTSRHRQRPQRYSATEFVEAVSDNETGDDSNDDIVGEAVYDDEYLRSRKQRRKAPSSSEGDEEYHWDDENAEDEEEDDDSLSISEDIEETHRSKKSPSHSRRRRKLRSIDELQLGLRRSKRASQTRVNYRQYEMSDSEANSMEINKSNASDGHLVANNNVDSDGNQDLGNDEDDQEMKDQELDEDHVERVDREKSHSPNRAHSPDSEAKDVPKRRFLDLNELAPGIGLDDGPSTIMKDEDMNEL